MTKKLIFWLFIIALVVGGIIWLVAKSNNSPSSSQTTYSLTVSDTDWTKGNKEAKLTLIEYSDFQCPACGAYYPILKQLSQEFEEDVLFVYRHFPLRQIHPNADLAARASEAAGTQSKFWEMHDLIFKNQTEWSLQRNTKAKETFVKYAQSLNLNIEQFKNDIDSGETEEGVDNDYKSGLKFQVNATPTFFLNGTKLQNPRSYEEFQKIITNNL